MLLNSFFRIKRLFSSLVSCFSCLLLERYRCYKIAFNLITLCYFLLCVDRSSLINIISLFYSCFVFYFSVWNFFHPFTRLRNFYIFFTHLIFNKYINISCFTGFNYGFFFFFSYLCCL